MSRLLTPAELEVMSALWDLDEGTVRDVLLRLEGGRAVTTVSTLVRILEQKGFVRSRKSGRRHLYRAAIPRQTYQRASVRARRPLQLAAIQAALAARKLPAQLDAVPLVESGYENIDAGEHGAGLWQFIVPTAKHYGLNVAPGHDERMDPALEAAAAARYLDELYRQFGDWPLALAAYTQGQDFVDKVIEREKTRDAWELIRRGALETYAAKVMAAAMVIADPSLAGL